MSISIPVVWNRRKALKEIRGGKSMVVINRGDPTDPPGKASWSAVVCVDSTTAARVTERLSTRKPLRSMGNRGYPLGLPTITVIGSGEEIARELEEN